MSELLECLDSLGRDRAVRAVILAAAGKVFSSGHDLGEMKGLDVNGYRRVFALCTELMAKIQAIPQPVIAEVHRPGYCRGLPVGGRLRPRHCRSETAAFATPGVKIGLFCTTPMVALTRAIGRKRAFEMLVTGEPVDARTAAEWGLVNRAVRVPDLRVETLRLARQVAAASPFVTGLGKQAFYTQIDLDPGQSLRLRPGGHDHEFAGRGRAGGNRRVSPTKRPPCWKGK